MKVAKFTFTATFVIIAPAPGLNQDDITPEVIAAMSDELKQEYQKALATNGEVTSLEVEAEIAEV